MVYTLKNINICDTEGEFFSIDFFVKISILKLSMAINKAKFSIGDIVKHKHFNFRGVIYDVDFEFNNSEEWYQSIPKDVRPKKDQPFYHLLAENNEITYEAYVSEQNLLTDDSGEPIKHPLINEIFSGKNGSGYFRPSN
jgi:heat shock protein HspQ